MWKQHYNMYVLYCMYLFACMVNLFMIFDVSIVFDLKLINGYRVFLLFMVGERNIDHALVLIQAKCNYYAAYC